MNTLFNLTIPTFNKLLLALSKILDHAKNYAAEKKFDEAVLVNARLAPDMFALSRQVQVTCDFAKGCAARLAGLEVPKFEDTEKTLDELKARIQKTLDFIASIDPIQFKDAETRDVTVRIAGEEKVLKGVDYAREVAIPNFYFHLTTSYAILRHNGVAVGKNDYLGRT
jgi:uncharacterized protein